MHVFNPRQETLHQVWEQLPPDSKQRLSSRLFFLALRACRWPDYLPVKGPVLAGLVEED